MSRVLTSLVAVALLACGDDGGPAETTFGGTSAGGSTTTSDPDCAMVEIPGCAQVVEVCEGGSCSCQCGDASSSTAMPETTTSSGGESTASSSPQPTTDPDASSDEGGATSSSTSGGSSPLSECLSIDIWESCAQYCENAKEAMCQESGCDGATLHAYDSGGECSASRNGTPVDQPCGDPLPAGGGVSFVRCCCS